MSFCIFQAEKAKELEMQQDHLKAVRHMIEDELYRLRMEEIYLDVVLKNRRQELSGDKISTSQHSP